MEAIRVSFKQDDTLDNLAGHTVTQELPRSQRQLVCRKWMIPSSQKIFSDPITDISRSAETTMIASVTLGGYNGGARTDKLLKAILQDLINKATD